MLRYLYASFAFIAALTLAAPLVHAQGYNLNGQLQPGNTATPAISSQSVPGLGLYFGPSPKGAGVIGHLESGTGSGITPTVSSCGTGTLTTGSTDTAGDVTATGATSCTVTFSAAYTAVPSCSVTDYTTAAGLKAAVTNTAIVVTGLTSGDRFSYVCVAKSGG